jgi:hypothetical protein
MSYHEDRNLEPQNTESLAHYIHKKGLGKLTRAYEVICANVRKAGSGYEAGETLVGSERPFGRGDLVRAVFGIREEDDDDEDEEGSGSESEDEESESEEEEDTR